MFCFSMSAILIINKFLISKLLVILENENVYHNVSFSVFFFTLSQFCQMCVAVLPEKHKFQISLSKLEKNIKNWNAYADYAVILNKI